MHCNQPFCINPNNVFNNGYGYVYNPYNPPPINSGFYPPSVVGEGDVSCVTLPDGTCQFYFTPTANWCAPNNYPCHNMSNTNHNNPYWNPNTGTWFVRSITSPIPALWNNSPQLQYEAPIPFRSLDYSMTAINNGFQLKFHNDKWTSTADIHYFYPCLREIDYTPPLPTRGCAGVQVDTPMVPTTTCHYEVVCPKPCHYEVVCPKPCHCISCPTPDTKPTEVVDCQCSSSSKNKRPLTTNSAQRLQLLPGDKRKKRIRFEKKIKKNAKSKSNDVICECSPPRTLEKVTQNVIESKTKDVICACSSPPSLEKLAQHIIESSPCVCSPCSSSQEITPNVTESKSKDVDCECTPPLSVDKSAATHDTHEAICRSKKVQSPCCWTKEKSKKVQSPCSWTKEKSEKVQSPCCCEEKPEIRGDAFVKRKSESWCPLTEAIKKVFSLDKRDSETACCSGSYCN